MTIPRVVIESPYAGDTEEAIERNVTYLRRCLRDSLQRGEAPFASHGLYTQRGVLNDRDRSERALGIRAGFSWRCCAEKTVVYTDLGITDGMRAGIEHAHATSCPVEYRELGIEAGE